MRIEKRSSISKIIENALRPPQNMALPAEEEAKKQEINKDIQRLVEEVQKPAHQTMHLTSEKYLAKEPSKTEAELDYSEYYSHRILKEMQGKSYYCGPVSILAMMGQEPLVNLESMKKEIDEDKIGGYFGEDIKNKKKGLTVLDFAELAHDIIPKGVFSQDYKRINAQILVFSDIGNIVELYAPGSVQRDGRIIGKSDLSKECVDLVEKRVRIENAMLDTSDIVFLIRMGYNVAINYKDHYVVGYGVEIKHYKDNTKYADIRFFDPETGDNGDSENVSRLKKHLEEGQPVEGVAIRLQLLDS